jgi:NADPH:quinone reductase-like Zn-dependent oxidoreductase
MKRPGKEEVRIGQKIANVNPKKLAFFRGQEKY